MEITPSADPLAVDPWPAYFADRGLPSARRIGAGVEGVVYGLGDGRVAKVWSGRPPAGLALTRQVYADIARHQLPFATPEIFDRLLDYYGCEDEDFRAGLIAITKDGSKRGWWLSYRDVINATANDLILLEADASTYKTYEPSFIPGLFQTPEYARIVIDRLRIRSGGTVEDLVQVRMARQSILTRQNPVQLWAVIHEAALCSNANRPDIMVPQLDRLLTLSRLSNVNIQVMPIGAAVHPGMSGAFALMGFPQRHDLDVVLAEGLLSSLWVEDPADVELYRAKFQEITAEALPVDSSLDFITAQRDKIK
ncbi:DUF5753 domain-containing protein [Kitasatospora sp. NPDC059408]|uniref:DUF5753 domain-containing protein n=1 Tax=Kitasatospora sp. NPDC059408 TaxID=3346823 RepID=UPI0036D1DEB5